LCDYVSVRQGHGIRHEDLSRIADTASLEKMICLIHDSIECIIKLPTILLTFLAGRIRRNKDIFVCKKSRYP